MKISIKKTSIMLIIVLSILVVANILDFVKDKNSEKVLQLIENKESRDKKDENGRDLLQMVAISGDLDLFIKVESYGFSLERKSYRGFDSFDLAVMNGNVDIVKYILKKNKKYSGEFYLLRGLSFASYFHKYKVIKLFIDHGVDINKRFSFYGSPLLDAINGGIKDESALEDVFEVLCENNAKINVFDRMTNLPLVSFLIKNSLKTLFDIVLDREFDVEIKDNYGRTPLFIASENNDDYYFRKLLDKGANIKARDYFGNSLVDTIKKTGNKKYLKYLK